MKSFVVVPYPNISFKDYMFYQRKSIISFTGLVNCGSGAVGKVAAIYIA
jgi:hypothetical protein